MTPAPPAGKADEVIRVSVVIPTYNCSGYLARALDSVFGQTHLPDEVIVVDDGSTDDTQRVLAQYPERSRVRYVGEAHQGVSAARNAGVAAARHEWIAFLDADDVWLPKRLERGIGLLQRAPHLRWVAGAYHEKQLNGRERLCGLPPHLRHKLEDGLYFENVFDVLVSVVRIQTSTLLIERACIDKVGGFDTALKRREDLDLWVRLGHRYPRIGYVTEPISMYVRRPDSLVYVLPAMSVVDQIHWLKRAAARSSGNGNLCRGYGRHLTVQACRKLIHERDQEGLREVLDTAPEDWVPPALRFPLQTLARSNRFGWTMAALALETRLILLGRHRGLDG